MRAGAKAERRRSLRVWEAGEPCSRGTRGLPEITKGVVRMGATGERAQGLLHHAGHLAALKRAGKDALLKRMEALRKASPRYP